MKNPASVPAVVIGSREVGGVPEESVHILQGTVAIVVEHSCKDGHANTEV
jgi:hypothetical protein